MIASLVRRKSGVPRADFEGRRGQWPFDHGMRDHEHLASPHPAQVPLSLVEIERHRAVHPHPHVLGCRLSVSFPAPAVWRKSPSYCSCPVILDLCCPEAAEVARSLIFCPLSKSITYIPTPRVHDFLPSP